MQRVSERLQREDEDTLDPPLPATARERLQQLCLQHRGGRFCVEAAEQQLNALEPALAVQALQVVCDAGRVSACERVAPLRDLRAELRLVPAQQVPCGRYQADGGVIDMLDFGDGTRGRLHDGAIHLQQNGEPLVLRQLGNGDLLGMDAQTGYQRYQPVPGTAQCTPRARAAVRRSAWSFPFDRQGDDMHSPAPRRRWLAWALLLATPMAAAQSPQCGLFKADEGSGTLRISSPNRGEQKHFGSAPTPVAFQQIDGKLQLVNLEYGLPSALQVRDRGRTVEVDGTVYILQASAQCAATAAPAEGSCLADAAACLDNRREADPAALEAACREGVPGMCLQLADRWHEEAMPTVEADPALAKAALDAALSGIKLPAACDDGGFEQGTPACAAALEAAPQCRSSWSRRR